MFGKFGNFCCQNFATDEVDVSRFPIVSSDEILELKSVAVNKKNVPLYKTVDERVPKLGKVPPS